MNAEPHWNRRPSDSDPAWEQPYIFGNILPDSKLPHKSRRRINYTTVFCAALLVLYALCWIL